MPSRRRRRDDYSSDDDDSDSRRDRRSYDRRSRRRRRDYYYSDDDSSSASSRQRRRRRRSSYSPQPRMRPKNRVYVGNIPYTMTTEDLRDHFHSSGRIADCVVKTDSATGNSRGFGIIQFESSSDAARAIERWHNRTYESRPLVVRYDRDVVGGGGGGGSRRPPPPPSSSSRAPPSDEEIRKLLVEREKARVSRDYRTADDIRANLREQGVTVDDVARTWACVDGRRGDRPSAFQEDEKTARQKNKDDENDDHAKKNATASPTPPRRRHRRDDEEEDGQEDENDD